MRRFDRRHPVPHRLVEGITKRLGTAINRSNFCTKKLHAKELVNYEKYKPITLTAQGEKVAALIIRKHRLTEMYLVEKMGFGWEEVHEIAEQMEHIKSSDFFDKMDELLGYPTVDPHGSPIPDKEGNIHRKAYRKLSSFNTGEMVVLSAVVDATDDFLRFLNSRNLQLGTRLEVLGKEDFDGSMVVRYAEREAETLSEMVCDRLLVEG